MIPQNPYPSNPYSYCCDAPTNVAAIDSTGKVLRNSRDSLIIFLRLPTMILDVILIKSSSFTTTITSMVSTMETAKSTHHHGTISKPKDLTAKLFACVKDGVTLGVLVFVDFTGILQAKLLKTNQFTATLVITSFLVFFSHILIAGSIANVGIWEHGCFSRGGTANVLPGGFSFCFYVDKDNSYGKLSAVQLSNTITAVRKNYRNFLMF